MQNEHNVIGKEEAAEESAANENVESREQNSDKLIWGVSRWGDGAIWD
jgi:hypothetical protein